MQMDYTGWAGQEALVTEVGSACEHEQPPQALPQIAHEGEALNLPSFATNLMNPDDLMVSELPPESELLSELPPEEELEPVLELKPAPEPESLEDPGADDVGQWDAGVLPAPVNPAVELRPILQYESNNLEVCDDSVTPGTSYPLDIGTFIEASDPVSENNDIETFVAAPDPAIENNAKPDSSLHDDGVGASESQKTELEREMELFEAAEREEQSRLLASLRSDQSGEVSPAKQTLHSIEDGQADQKPARETTLPERRKRGRKPLASQARKEEEDVCFVCFDGGKLILCDKRSCPKAYHIECTGRESDFFQKKGQWLCGWHVCAHCTRSATMHCYTCPTAFCNNCVGEADFLCIRKDRGLCEICYPIVNMIEHNETINADGVLVDFDDQETYECLFKEYWEDLKQRISLTLVDVENACKAKEAGELLGNGGNDAERASEEEDGSGTDSDGRPTTRLRQLLKRKRLTRASIVEDASGSDYEEEGEEADDNESKPKRGRVKAREFDGWATKELLDFIQTMREDRRKPLSRLAVNKLLWGYIEGNKLLNPRRRGQIICDEKLQRLFGKKSVGRFEMMKLLSSHLAPKKSAFAKSQDFQSVDNDMIDLENSDDNRPGKNISEKQRKSRRKSDDNKFSKPDPYEYAAIDVKNINLIYLKRSLLDDLRDDPDFENKVFGAFVRIRVPGMVNKNDTCYRLVQIIGIKKVCDNENPERVTDVMLEILNLRKREEVTVDSVSNQDFTEEECQRLRQSVKYGFLKAMTVGELEEKAKALQEVKVKDWFETELLRLSHLRDRASEKGHKRELRECVEKLQLLSSPEEKERQLNAPLEINTDPHMDPNYESDNEEFLTNDSQGNTAETQSPWEKGSSTKIWDKNSSIGAMEKQSNNWSNAENSVKWDTELKGSGRDQKDPGKDGDLSHFVDKEVQGWTSAHDNNTGEFERGWEADLGNTDHSDGWNHQGGLGRRDGGWGENLHTTERSLGWNSQVGFGRKDGPLDKGTEKGGDTYRADMKLPYNRVEGSFDRNSNDWKARRDPIAGTHIPPGPNTGFMPSATATAFVSTTEPVDFEKEKIWYYQDPTKTVQGPFSMEQLRKWEKTKLFPLDLRIWKKTGNQDESILLTDALLGKFPKNISPSSIQGNNAGDFSQGWGPGKDLRNTSMPSRSGTNWQERSGRAGWEGENYAGPLSKINDGNAWGSSWTEKRAENEGWGVKSESAWGSQVPGEMPREDGREPFRGPWGRDLNYRGPEQYRPGNDSRFTRRKDIPCKFFARGMCKKGPACEFKH